MIDLEDIARFLHQHNINENLISYRLHSDSSPDAWIPIFIIDIYTNVIETDLIETISKYMKDQYYELKHIVRNDDCFSLHFRKMPPY